MNMERFHTMSRLPYRCSKTTRPCWSCWCSKPIIWELNIYHMLHLFLCHHVSENAVYEFCVLEPAEWRHICKEDQYMLSDQWSRKCWIIRYNLVVCTVQWTNFEPVKIRFFKRFLLHCRHRFLVSFDHLHSALYNWTTRVSLSKIRSGMF